MVEQHPLVQPVVNIMVSISVDHLLYDQPFCNEKSVMIKWWPLLEEIIYKYIIISVHLKSGLITGVAMCGLVRVVLLYTHTHTYIYIYICSSSYTSKGKKYSIVYVNAFIDILK